MITIDLQGGLGNQMFQIATCYNLAKLNNDVAEFNFNKCETPNQGVDSKKYKNTLFKEFIHNDNLNFDKIFTQKYHKFQPIPYQKNLKLNGYFQSEKYFIENKDIIIDKFNDGIKSEHKKYEKVKNFMDSFKDTKPLVVMHIRRGDYLKFPHIHTPCSVEYYQKSLIEIESIIGKFTPIIISDDKNWCKENFNIQISPFDDEIEDLILMSNSDHNIIANSSFSWWGAYLNKNQNKIIISPKSWFGFAGPQDQEDITPNNWIKI